MLLILSLACLPPLLDDTGCPAPVAREVVPAVEDTAEDSGADPGTDSAAEDSAEPVDTADTGSPADSGGDTAADSGTVDPEPCADAWGYASADPEEWHAGGYVGWAGFIIEGWADVCGVTCSGSWLFSPYLGDTDEDELTLPYALDGSILLIVRVVSPGAMAADSETCDVVTSAGTVSVVIWP